MIKFGVKKKETELLDYSGDATLRELSESLEEFRLHNGLRTKNCRGCGECCSDDIPVLGFDMQALKEGLGCASAKELEKYLILPGKPDLAARNKATGDLARTTGVTPLEAAVIYEYNNAEPVIIAKKQNGECLFLDGGLCSRYAIRPYSCGLYLCNMGEKLSYIQEMVIRQGTWHAYHLLGWVPESEIAHNPFLKYDSYDSLPVKEFDFGLKDALDHLFFYF